MARLLDRLYGCCPVPVQNLGISLYGYYWKRERFGPEFEKTVAEFRRRDRWPADRMREYLVSALRSVLRRAFEAPYYRERWTAAGVRDSLLEEITPETLHRLPVLPKQDVRQTPEAFVPEAVRRSRRLRNDFTSGSTGTPVRCIRTRAAIQRYIGAREVRSFGWAGTSVTRPRAMIGGRKVVSKGIARPPFYRYNVVEKQVYFSAYHMSPAHIGNYVEGFNRHRPEVSTGYAFSHFLMAQMMRQEKLALDYAPAAVVASSEKLTGPMKQSIRKSFGCRAYEEYGACENCGLACECEHGSLHVSPDFGIIEIVDADGNPVPPGVEGRILCTGLLNDAQFLVRYDIGDTGIWSQTPCPCGRNHLPVLQEVCGRLEDVVVGPDGREMVRFHGIFIDLPHVLEGQVVQEELDRFLVRVIATDAFGDEQIERIRRRFEERLGPVRVTVERVAELERGPNGKFRAVISHLGQSERSGQPSS